MVDATLSRFCIDIEILQVVVEVDRPGAEITPEKSSVRGEDGGEVHLALFRQGKSNSG
jgi:hypothetical protein